MLSGHEAAWREWRTALASPRMHHAWILSGIKGLGKGAFARAAARELVGSGPSAAGDGHPDVLVLDPLPANEDEEKKRAEGKPFQTRRNITIDQIRRMQQRLTMRPTLGARRAIVIDPADDMEKNAVNALLKSLEEPPAGTYFLLVAHRAGRLLPTVRSRCATLHFAPQGDAAIAKLLDAAMPQASAAAKSAAVTAARGSPGAALDYLARDLGTMQGLMLRLAREGDEALALRGALADALGPRPDRGRIAAMLDLARATLAGEIASSPRMRQERIIAAHAALVRLTGQAPTYNFDPGLLALEIGGLLASTALPREAA